MSPFFICLLFCPLAWSSNIRGTKEARHFEEVSISFTEYNQYNHTIYILLGLWSNILKWTFPKLKFLERMKDFDFASFIVIIVVLTVYLVY